jgi:hypothetical protein
MNSEVCAQSGFRTADAWIIAVERPAAMSMHAHHTNELHATASRLDLAVKIFVLVIAAIAGLTIRLVLRR